MISPRAHSDGPPVLKTTAPVVKLTRWRRGAHPAPSHRSLPREGEGFAAQAGHRRVEDGALVVDVATPQ